MTETTHPPTQPPRFPGDTRAPEPPKILCSFHYFRKEPIAPLHAAGAMIFGDSGAFSAAASGNPISFQQYAQWVRRWRSVLFCYPALDVIGDPETTWRNHIRMERAGLAPLPVYHFGSPLRHLQGYLDAGHRYIALGGMVGKYGKDAKQWLIRCFKEAEPYGAVFHGFGRTRMEDLRDFPWYSVDSSTFTRVTRYGQVPLFDTHSFTMLSRSEPKSLYRHGRLLRAHGVEPADMDNRNPRVRELAYRVATLAWRRCEEWLRQRHGAIAGPRPGDPPGPHVFLADTSSPDLRRVIAAVRDYPGPYLTRSRP